MSAKKKGGLSLELKRSGSGKPLSKPILNLAPAEAKRQLKLKTVAIILLVLVALAAAYKYLYLDQEAKRRRAQSATVELQQQLTETQRRREELELDDVAAEYYHLTYDGMTDGELALVDRVAILDMLERVMIGDNRIQHWTLFDNELTIDMQTTNLDEVKETAQLFLKEDLVLYCTVSTAYTSVDQPTGEETEVTEYLLAQIIVYLSNPPEEEPEEEIEAPEGFVIEGAQVIGGVE